MKQYDILIIGGGAAGFFTAINAAERDPSLKIAILERGKEVLAKVRISGGGRCNVTHAEFVPRALSKQYPRGEKELLGPFHHFMTGDTMEWFESRGIALKIEEDGRVFPVSDSSQSIIDCFMQETQRLGIQVLTQHPVRQIHPGSPWKITTVKGDFSAKKLMLATGSNPRMWKILEQLGHRIIPPVPSLFTFNIQDSRIKGLSGITSEAVVKVPGKGELEARGNLLITHWGISGPAILKLSAWGARFLHERHYEFPVQVNWVSDYKDQEMLFELKNLKVGNARQQVRKHPYFRIPKRLWSRLVEAAGIGEDISWAAVNRHQLLELSRQLTQCQFQVMGKSTFKEEFVTAGGVDLREVDFRTFESKLHKELFLAGEVLNIDAVTGGFNFQNAWTGGFLAAAAMTL